MILFKTALENRTIIIQLSLFEWHKEGQPIKATPNWYSLHIIRKKYLDDYQNLFCVKRIKL